MDRVEFESSDGTSLVGYTWSDPDAARADVLLVHGYAEHAGRYAHVASELAAAGCRVRAVDLRGHGHSGGERGHVGRFHEYVEDVQAAVHRLVEQPYYLFGHSMGGLVVLDAVREGLQPAPEGMLLSAPLLGTLVEVPTWKRVAARLLSRIAPTVSIPNGIEEEHLSHDPAIVEAYRRDPLIFHTATARWYRQMRQAMERVNQHGPDMDQPMFIAWGTDDRIVDPLALSNFCTTYGGEAHAHTPHGLYHEVLNEPGNDVLETMLGWLQARHPAAASA